MQLNHPQHSLRLTVALILSSFLALFSFVCLSPTQVFAQLEVEEEVAVSASVPDTIEPSTPILIAPADGSTLTDSTPTFIWTASTDNLGVTSYTFYLDGVVHTSLIPTSDTETGAFILTYDSLLDQYSLTHKSSIGEGNHTWKIVALDAAGNEASSTTWSLRIDSQAPTFVITDVGDEETSISAQDISTIPDDPVELDDNEPELSGTGEANSDVRLQLHREDNGELFEEYNFTIDGDGNWSVTLDTLERGVVYLMTFQITDQAGLLSVLEDVPLRIRSAAIVITIPEVILPPEVPIDNPIVIPIDVIPVEEVSRVVRTIQVTIQRVVEDVAEVLIPEPLRVRYANATQTTKMFLSPLWYTHLMVLLFLMVLPLSKFVILSLPFGRDYSANIALAVLLAVLGYSDKKRASLIIAADSMKKVPFAAVALTSMQSAGETSGKAERLLMSDQDGYLPRLLGEPGSYTLRVSIDKMSIEYAKNRPAHLEQEDWYQGGEFSLAKEIETQALVIPVMVSLEQTRTKFKNWLLQRPIGSLSLLICAVIILMITPTIGNFITLGIFGICWLFKSWRSYRTNYLATFYSSNKLELPYTVVRLTAGEPRNSTLLHADDHANASTWLKDGSYDCRAIHNAYRPKQQEILTIEGGRTQEQLIVLTPIIA